MNSLKCPSTEGKNTFGCVVNGKLWLPEGSLGQGATHAEIYKRPDTLAVNIYSSNQDQSIFMSIRIDIEPRESGLFFTIDGRYGFGFNSVDGSENAVEIRNAGWSFAVGVGFILKKKQQ